MSRAAGQVLAEALHRAAELEPAERRAFLDRTAGDEPRLHAELEALLAEPATSEAGLLGTGGALGGEFLSQLAARIEGDRGIALVGRQVGAIRLDAVIGQGGMGTVYRGFDSRLERAVAVKAVRFPTADSTARFRHEARLLGGAEHPSICRVYELVEAPECDYLVLELIDGVPLGRWAAAGRDLASRLRVVEEIAAALAFAHGRGIVHRDLKPDNILVTPAGGVKILDFGIATLAPQSAAGSSTGASAAGESASTRPIVGTLGYMSPEQARGEVVGPASDLFSLGLILQELLGGRPAYPRNLAYGDLLARVRRGETDTPLILGREPRELLASLQNTIPSRRPSAEDAVSRLRELRAAPQRRRLRRALAALASAAAVLVLAAISLVVRERLASARAAAETQQLIRQAEEIGWRMAIEELGPRRNLAPVREQLGREVDELGQQIPRLSPGARPIADLAVGRAAFALGDLERARRHLDAAWAAGQRDGALAWSRGLVYGQLFAEARERERLVAGRAAGPSPATEQLRQESLAMLGAAGDASERDQIESLLATYEGRVDDGLAAVGRLLASRPTAWPAHLTAARLHRAAATDLDRQGDYAGAAKRYMAARLAASAAVEIARSSPAGWLELCRAAFEEALVEQRTLYRGASPAAGVARAACEGAAEVAPWSSRAAALRAAVVLLEMQRESDLTVVDTVARRAVAELSDLLERDPADSTARSFRAAVRQTAVERRLEAGGDTEHLPGLLEDRRRLAADEPGSPVAWARYCQALGIAAGTAVSRGAPDREAQIVALVEALREGGQRFPDHVYFQLEQPLFASILLAMERLDAGGDCETPFAEAAAHQARALAATEPSLPRNVALALDGLTQCRLRDGRPVGESARDALRVAARTLELAPEWASSHFGLGWSLLRAAEVDRAAGRSPLDHLAAAERAYARGFELEASRIAGWPELAEGRAIEAGWHLDRGESPDAALARARSALARGLPVLEGTREAARARALLAALEARDRVRRGEAVDRALAPARLALEAAREAGLGAGGARAIERELALAQAPAAR